MSISSLLDIAWDHAYWAEGPRFAGRGYAGGGAVSYWPDEMAAEPTGGLKVGSMSLDIGVGATDLDQATGSKQPLYRSSHASFNSKPIVEFDGSDDSLTTIVGWATLTAPNYIICIARTRDATSSVPNAGSFRSFGSANRSGSTVAGEMGQLDGIFPTRSKWETHNSGLSEKAQATNTNAHLFYMVQDAGAGSDFQVDAVSLGGNIGTLGSDGCSLGAANNSPFVQLAYNWCPCDIAFWAIKSTAFTGTELADIHTYAQSHYGTP